MNTPEKAGGSLMSSKGLLILVFLTFSVTFSRGQELEPRAFWISPVKTNAATFSYAYSTGDFAVDPSLPVEGRRVYSELPSGWLLPLSELLWPLFEPDAHAALRLGTYSR